MRVRFVEENAQEGDAESSQTASRLRMHVLASGSKGNATLIEDVSSGRLVLIDCGICKRDFFDRASNVGADLNKLEAILITHEHSDHTKGLGVVTRGLAKEGVRPTLYTSAAIRRVSGEIIKIQDNCTIHYFTAGEALSVAGMEAHVFETSHDAIESFGFRIEGGQDVIGYMTDTGVITPAAHEALKACRILALESNHDARMLEKGPYPYVLKKRVASEVGHLSNGQATQELEELLSGNLEKVVAMHISENNNTYRLPKQVFEEVLHKNAHSAQVHIAYQNRVTTIF